MTDPVLDLEPEAPTPRFTRTHGILLAVALAVVAGVWGAYHALTHKDAGDHLREAETALARGDPKAAAIALKNVLQCRRAAIPCRRSCLKPITIRTDVRAEEARQQASTIVGKGLPTYVTKARLSGGCQIFRQVFGRAGSVAA